MKPSWIVSLDPFNMQNPKLFGPFFSISSAAKWLDKHNIKKPAAVIGLSSPKEKP